VGQRNAVAAGGEHRGGGGVMARRNPTLAAVVAELDRAGVRHVVTAGGRHIKVRWDGGFGGTHDYRRQNRVRLSSGAERARARSAPTQRHRAMNAANCAAIVAP
jgi:hypothetical protein